MCIPNDCGRPIRRKVDTRSGPAYNRIAERGGKMIARVAAGRKLLTLVYYGLRDGEIRCLGREAAGASSGTARTRARAVAPRLRAWPSI